MLRPFSFRVRPEPLTLAMRRNERLLAHRSDGKEKIPDEDARAFAPEPARGSGPAGRAGDSRGDYGRPRVAEACGGPGELRGGSRAAGRPLAYFDGLGGHAGGAGGRRPARRRAALAAGRPPAHHRPRGCDPAREGQRRAYRPPATGGRGGAGLGPHRGVLGDPLRGSWEPLARSRARVRRGLTHDVASAARLEKKPTSASPAPLG